MELTSFIDNFEMAIEAPEAGTVKPETKFRELDIWDSLAALNLIVMINADYEVEVSGNELKLCTTAKELFDFVQSKKSA